MEPNELSRRALIHKGALYLMAAGVGSAAAGRVLADDEQPAVRFGAVTDLHYADKDTAGSRHYRRSLAKLAAAAERFERDRVSFVVELGDFIDRAAEVDVELGYLNRVNEDFAALPGDKHYVLGNHCVDTLTKDEFLEAVGQEAPHYSFDQGGVHFVVLDACFNSDGEPYGRRNFRWTDANIPQAQLDWLAEDLAQTEHKTVVFAHQRLDTDNNYAVRNAAAVRQVLEGSDKVLAVLQGHYHRNDHNLINGIHYCVMRAMVEGAGDEDNGFATVDVFADGTIRIAGALQQEDYAW